MNASNRTALLFSGVALATLLLAGCGSDTSVDDEPTTSGVPPSELSTGPATTPLPAPETAPAGGGAQSPTTAQESGGPSRTVSGPSSATPPIQDTPAPPTGDNLPGEGGGPQGTSGGPGDDD